MGVNEPLKMKLVMRWAGLACAEDQSRMYFWTGHPTSEDERKPLILNVDLLV